MPSSTRTPGSLFCFAQAVATSSIILPPMVGEPLRRTTVSGGGFVSAIARAETSARAHATAIPAARLPIDGHARCWCLGWRGCRGFTWDSPWFMAARRSHVHRDATRRDATRRDGRDVGERYWRASL